jgi:hypothetical protein
MTGGSEGKRLLAEAIDQLASDGPVVGEFLRGEKKLTADALAERRPSCGC